MPPRPYYSDELVTLYHGDSRALLPLIEDASVDLVLTDPPYGIRYQSRENKDAQLRQPIAGDEDLNALRNALPQLERVMSPNRHAYIFASPLKLGEAIEAVGAVFQVKNVIVWDKGQQGTKGDLVAGYASNWEAILYASKGRRPLIGPRPRAVYRYDWSSLRDPVHPTVKPVGLLSWLIAKSTQPGELVIDPFAGSGTTLAAAKALGRRAIGIEIDEEYCRRAVARLTPGSP